MINPLSKGLLVLACCCLFGGSKPDLERKCTEIAWQCAEKFIREFSADQEYGEYINIGNVSCSSIKKVRANFVYSTLSLAYLNERHVVIEATWIGEFLIESKQFFLDKRVDCFIEDFLFLDYEIKGKIP